MACYRPVTAWYSNELNHTGKRSLVFSKKEALQPDDPIEIACSQCVGCRLERSRQSAIRCVHEASLYEDNCFITLTFNPESLQARENCWSVNVRDWQLFMKRLRKRHGPGIRYFHCGEYGDTHKRPHYHGCLFNFDFKDKQLWKVNNGNRIYTSDDLSELWPFGFSTIGDVTFESAAYVARYIMKKINGDRQQRHYEKVDYDTGEVNDLQPEYTSMSLKPGLGREWYELYSGDVYPKDYITVNGIKQTPPKYYDKLHQENKPFEFDEIKEKRKENAYKKQHDNTPERLAARLKVQELKLALLKRNHDQEQIE